MPRRKKLFFDTKVNEWVFHKLVNLTADQKKNLNVHELRLINSKPAIRRLVNNENLERILSLLTKVGIQWNISFFETAFKPGELLKEAYSQYSLKGKSVDVIDKMFEKSVFVINSRDMAISMAIMSLNCHSDSYIINPQFFSLNRTMKALKNANISTIFNPTSVEHNAISRETRDLAKLCIEAMRIEDYLTSHFNIRMLDAMILWLLYQTPYNYVSMGYIKRNLMSQYKPASIANRCSFLFKERRMIEKRPSQEREPSFIIVQEGIITIGMINNHLINTVYGT